jgi:hypothetical protein
VLMMGVSCGDENALPCRSSRVRCAVVLPLVDTRMVKVTWAAHITKRYIGMEGILYMAGQAL